MDKYEANAEEDRLAIKDYQAERLPLYKFNFLEHHVAKIFKINKSNTSPSKSKQVRTPKAQQGSPAKSPSSPFKSSDASTIRLLNDAESISKNMLRVCQDHGLLPEHLNMHLRLEEFRSQRNTIAHSTERQFARVLRSRQYKDSDEYKEWASLFPFVYGKTVEELASEEA